MEHFSLGRDGTLGAQKMGEYEWETTSFMGQGGTMMNSVGTGAVFVF